MQPTISIIVPNHNHKHCLPVLFDSILAQRGVDLEVVVVDDCSEESCGDLLDAYRAKGLNVRALYNNRRVYTKEARLLGIEGAAGRIIAFADADDTLKGDDTLARHVAMFDEAGADVLHFRAAFTDNIGNFKRYFHMGDPFAEILEGRDIFTKYLKTDIHGTVLWNKLYSKDLCLSVCETAHSSKVLRFVEDLYLTALFLMNAKKYVGSDLVGYGYYWWEKDRADTVERAVYTYFIREELVPYVRAKGFDEALAADYGWFLEHYLSLCTGRLSVAVGKEEGDAISDATVASLLEFTDAATLIKVLLLGNRINAEKIVRSSRLLRGASRPEAVNLYE